MGSSLSALARCSVHDGRVVPHWLGESDHPWLRNLIEVYESFVGEPRRALDARLAELRSEPCPSTGLRLAAVLLDRSYRDEMVGPLPPPSVRAAVFRAAAQRGTRVQVLERVAAELGVAPEDIERSLLADLPGERVVRSPAEPVSAVALAERGNEEIARAILRSSSEVTLELEGNARAVVRHAKLRGLICTPSTRAAGEAIALCISGPLSLFRRTTLYGRHLAELVPMLPWCRRFEVEARCVIRGRDGECTLRSGDPIPAGPEPRLYDSALERRFAREFVRIAPDWDIVREPEPVAAEGSLVFPDFALVHRRDRSRRWLLEILGFWTADYVACKLRRLRAAGLRRLILCIDAERDCGREAPPANARVIRFQKRVDAREVLRILEADGDRSEAIGGGKRPV